jgi:hypothetical protein
MKVNVESNGPNDVKVEIAEMDGENIGKFEFLGTVSHGERLDFHIEGRKVILVSEIDPNEPKEE